MLHRFAAAQQLQQTDVGYSEDKCYKLDDMTPLVRYKISEQTCSPAWRNDLRRTFRFVSVVVWTIVDRCRLCLPVVFDQGRCANSGWFGSDRVYQWRPHFQPVHAHSAWPQLMLHGLLARAYAIELPQLQGVLVFDAPVRRTETWPSAF